MNIPLNVRILFFGNNSSIPTGYSRDNDFNERYIKICSAFDTSGGTNGGAASHGHYPSTNHIHNDITCSSQSIGTDTQTTAGYPLYRTAYLIKYTEPETTTPRWFNTWRNN